MLIGIDGNEANVDERVGVNVWGFEMLKRLKLPTASGRLQVKVYLSRPPRNDLPEETEFWKYRVIGPGKFWTRWRLPLDLYFCKPKPDVFLSLSHYAPKWAPMPRVVSIMDLSFLQFPEAFKPAVLWQLKHWTRESVKHAAHIITISEFNKQEIIKNYGCGDKKITVAYPGVSAIYRIFKGRTLGTQGPTLRGLRNKKYLLFVGTRQQKKNLRRLIEAFELARREFPDIELVAAGKTWKQFATGQSGKFRKLPGREVYETSMGIRYLGYVPENDLPPLMAGAEALVLPSLYEGFGIPAIEAMAVGTPVLASNVTSLPEIIGDAGMLFDPLNIEDIADKICQLLSMNAAGRRRLVRKSITRAKEFNWDKSAGKVLDILKSAAQDKDRY